MKPLSPLSAGPGSRLGPRLVPWLDYIAGLRVEDYPGAKLLIDTPSRIGGLLLWIIGLIPLLLAAKFLLPSLVHGHGGGEAVIPYIVLTLMFGWMLIPGLRMLQNEQRLLLTRPQLQWRRGPLPWPRQQALPATELRAASVRTTTTRHKGKNGKEYTTSKHALVLILRNGSEIIPFGHGSESSAKRMAETLCDWYRLECRTPAGADAASISKGWRLSPGTPVETLLGFSTGLPHLAVPLLALLLTASGVELWSEGWSLSLWRDAQVQAASAEAEAAAITETPPLTLHSSYRAELGLAKGVIALDGAQLAALPALETLRQHLRTGLSADDVEGLLAPLTSQVTPPEVFDQRRATLWAQELAPVSDFGVWFDAHSQKLWLQTQAKLMPLIGMEPPKKKALRRAEEAVRKLDEPPPEPDFESMQITPVLLDPPLAVAHFYAPDDPATDDPLLLVGWVMFEQNATPATQTRAVAEAYLRAFPEARPAPVQRWVVTQEEVEREAEIARVLAVSQAAVLKGDREALLTLLHPVAAAMLRTTGGWDEWLTAQMVALKPQMPVAYDISDRGDRNYQGMRYLILSPQGQAPEDNTLPKGYAHLSFVDGRWVLRELGWGETVLLGF